MSAKTGQELRTILKNASQSARIKAKLAGAPLFYIHNGKRNRENADGQKYVVVVNENGQSLEYPVKQMWN